MHQTRFERTVPSESVIEHALRGSVQKSFWVEDAPLGHPLLSLTGQISCDLAIVGAGYTGLWTAFLAKARHPEWRVVVLEAGSWLGRFWTQRWLCRVHVDSWRIQWEEALPR